VSAAEMARVNEEFIKNVAGLPLKNSDGPAVSISTLQVGSGTPQVLNVEFFCTKIEEAGVMHLNRRIANAEDILEKFGGTK
jgi:hypothetical protein